MVIIKMFQNVLNVLLNVKLVQRMANVLNVLIFIIQHLAVLIILICVHQYNIWKTQVIVKIAIIVAKHVLVLQNFNV